ncbi:hypothetical protein [Klebsiella quasipneumoniae]|uniref:hypothetical protein n=1 Tax=Klebsiella quasipneumoniae TaxID=1463165 RepID=UPI001AB02F43|nr:hypothetical protein [Klebsiella quasipneumoniae]MBO3250427.1 hypothetical protein [Klebsiella quasipneumoniae]HDU5834162.1 hypothetical protein [Klebsiella quasipneumoniae subsp. similipneumoniae]
MNISTVNELIRSLESAGELSIREQKFLKLAKAFKQLATENVALKESRNNLAEFIHEELDADYPLNMNLETHATDRIVAEAEARGVEKAIAHLEKKFSNIGVQIMNLQWLADSLREGADK